MRASRIPSPAVSVDPRRLPGLAAAVAVTVGGLVPIGAAGVDVSADGPPPTSALLLAVAACAGPAIGVLVAYLAVMNAPVVPTGAVRGRQILSARGLGLLALTIPIGAVLAAGGRVALGWGLATYTAVLFAVYVEAQWRARAPQHGAVEEPEELSWLRLTPGALPVGLIAASSAAALGAAGLSWETSFAAVTVVLWMTALATYLGPLIRLTGLRNLAGVAAAVLCAATAAVAVLAPGPVESELGPFLAATLVAIAISVAVLEHARQRLLGSGAAAGPLASPPPTRS